jgi:predicted MPP superfamily phosphohydrolase
MSQESRISRRRFLLGLGALGPVAALGLYTVMVERYLIVVRRHRIRVPRLPPAFDGWTLVHLTDLHHGALVPLGVIRSVVDRANALPKDAIVCTGDYVHERNATGEIDAVWPVLSGLSAPEGVYSTLGNHDHWADTERSLYWLERTGQNLRHRVAPIERSGQRLWLAGAGDLWEDHLPLDTLLADVPPDECRIVLAHNPDTADSAYSMPVDLFLCGHTHGGQIRLPGGHAPVLPVANKAYSSGLVTSPRGAPVFISRGIGWAIYPVRFNCLPEIALLELVPA